MLSGEFERVIGLQINAMQHWHLSYLADRLVAEVRLAGDATGDGFVGAADLDVILAHWGDTVLAGDAVSGDWSGDGTVGQQDLQVVLDHWGQAVPEPDPGDGNVPEPGTLAMLALLGMGLSRRRRK